MRTWILLGLLLGVTAFYLTRPVPGSNIPIGYKPPPGCKFIPHYYVDGEGRILRTTYRLQCDV